MARPDRLFVEKQSFRQMRVRMLLLIPPLILTLLAIWQAGLGHTWGKAPMSNSRLIGWSIFLWLVYLRLITVRLVTEVNAEQITIAMRGFWRSRRIPISAVKSARAVQFDAARDFGGYGIRSTRDATAYVAGGSEGVRLELSSGRPVVIGSQRAKELAGVMSRLVH